jgi:HlyD family secretion protein
MSKKIFPSEIAIFSAETLIKKHSTESKIIYLILLLTFGGFVVSLFFISVDVNVQSRGVITTKEKTNVISSPVYGKVQKINILENAYVKKGDTLIIIDTMDIMQNIALAKERIVLTALNISDLQKLTTLSKSEIMGKVSLITPQYQQELQKYKTDLYFQKSEIAILKKDYDRQQQLYQNKVIALAEYEQVKYKYESANLRYNQLLETQLTTWQNELANDKTQLISLNESILNFGKELQKYFIIASSSGYIQNLLGIAKGSILYPNQEICSLSPNTSLIVETFISSSDIGMINLAQVVRFRVEAFNANTWGFIDGNVSEIANDITIVQNQMQGFKVICSLNSRSLKYQNKTVTVKKGMTVTANFILTNRTLAQMLYDKVSDWLNPNIIATK